MQGLADDAADLLADGEPATVQRPGCAYEARFVPVREEEAAGGAEADPARARGDRGAAVVRVRGMARGGATVADTAMVRAEPRA